ncbi:MAG TPA: hypothetical protein VFK80_05710 [Limnochordia bacterium]|nr:hypothetical protein [Limnochordia bacterium]
MRPFSPFLDGYHDVAEQLAQHLRRRAEAAAAREAAEKAALESPAAFEARRARLRGHLLDAIGGLPELPDQVPAECTGVIEEPGLRIEKLLLETLPGVWATALLYLPVPGRAALGSAEAGASVARSESAGTPPTPGVLFVCGHHRDAKSAPEYQRVCRSLARAGLAVLALDPVGQGERLQYLDPETGEELVRWGTTEHSHAGFQCHVAGMGIARYFLADAMQALTYLAARPEVDGTRLGVTGNSGGGTQSSYQIFLDERLSCGAPCTFITSRESYLATGQAHDSEQNIAGALSAGLNYDDLAAGLAPKPLLLGAVASDFFCIEGTLQSYERLKRIYALYGRTDDVQLVISPGRHAFSPILREQVTRFFRRHLLGEEVELPAGIHSFAGPVESPLAAAGAPERAAAFEPAEAAEEAVLEPSQLNVTPRGQVALYRPEAKRVFDLNLAAHRSRRERATGAASPSGAMARLRRAVLSERVVPPLWVRQTADGEADGVWWAHRFGFSETGIAVPMIELRRADVDESAPLTVLALPEGTESLRERRADVLDWVGTRGRVLLFDGRGSGAAAQRPLNGHAYQAIYGSWYVLNYNAMMLGDSLMAMRAFDAYRVLGYAQRIAGEVHVAGEGRTGLEVLIAAVLDGRAASGRFSRLLRSFDDLIAEPLFAFDCALEVHGLADWPDVHELLNKLPSVQVDAFVDGRGEPLGALGERAAG